MPSMPSVEKQIEEILSLVDDLTDPKKMSVQKYLEFLDELIGGLQIRRDAAMGDLRAAARADGAEGDDDD